ncbi:MAG: TonB-dependent receptor plug domain-containing protein, partial [Bacteroidota bacterium]|nr:TonB-dependent receptor plug domain-containing protein [Bacteroidota bacterium]
KIRNSDKEQLQISTDKSIYNVEETIWFRAFLLHTTSSQISRQSEMIFVEILNETNNIVGQIILRAEPEASNGKFFLPDTLSSGYYWLRAFTKDMQVFNLKNYAEQPIYVYNKNKKEIQENNKESAVLLNEMPQVSFYPEGGNMITGAPSVVAMHITDKNGKSISAGCIIKDNRDTTVGVFTTNKQGLAKFIFEPSRFRKYKAIVTLNGKAYTYLLPAFNPFAGQIAIETQKDGSKKIRILLEDSIYSSNYQTYLISISKGTLCFASIGSGNYEVNIADDKLMTGITTFFLFDKNKKLLSERSVYKKQNVIIKADINKNILDKRDKAVINISFTNVENTPLVTSFSISATADRFLKPLENNEAEINNGWLSGDEVSDEDADLLMLMKNDVYNNSISNNASGIPANNYDSLFYIKGYLRDNNNIPLPGKAISLFSKTENSFYQIDTTDINGKFYYSLTGYADSTPFTLQLLNQEKSRDWKIEPDTLNFPKLNMTSTVKRRFNFQANEIFSNPDTLFFETQYQVLTTVKVQNSVPEEADYDKSKRVSTSSHIILGKNIKGEGNGALGNAILGVSGMRLISGFLVAGGPTSTHGITASSEPVIILNGVEVSTSESTDGTSPDFDYLNNFDARNIDFVEILAGTQGAAYGTRGGNGVIIINTSTKYIRSNPYSKAILSKDFYAKGYSYPPVF